VTRSLLQESTSHYLNKLQADLQYKYKHYKHRGVAIFSNHEIEDVQYQGQGNKTRALTAKLIVEPDLEPVYLTALHLSHRVEPNRIREVKDVERSLEKVFAEEGCQIWTGDFNCLTREDYDDKTWGDIARVRRENSWEPPRTAVAEEMARLGFTDCWASVGRPGPVSTCRFSTHIDYVFANRDLLAGWKCVEVLHVDSDASDHRPVLATFQKI